MRRTRIGFAVAAMNLAVILPLARGDDNGRAVFKSKNESGVA